MNEKMERPVTNHKTDPNIQGSTLVVGIDKKGNIIRFNQALEHLTGSTKRDVIDSPFSSYFSKQIPPNELQELIHQARFTPDTVDIDTSFQTVQGENVIVSWTGFAIKEDKDGRVSQLNLVGTPQTYNSSAAKTKNNSKKKKTAASNKTTSTKHKKSKKPGEKSKTKTGRQSSSTDAIKSEKKSSKSVKKPSKKSLGKKKDKKEKKKKTDKSKKQTLKTKKTKKDALNKKTTNSKEETTSSLLGQDAISERTEKASESDDVSDVKISGSVRKSCGVFGIVTQDRIDGGVDKAKNKQGEIQGSSKEKESTKKKLKIKRRTKLEKDEQKQYKKEDIEIKANEAKNISKQDSSFEKEMIPQFTEITNDTKTIKTRIDDQKDQIEEEMEKRPLQKLSFIKKLPKISKRKKIRKPRTPSSKKRIKISLPKFSTPSKQKPISLSSFKKKEGVLQLGEISVEKTLDEIKKENEQLKKENEIIKKHLQNAELKRKDIKDFLNTKLRFFRDSIGIKKKREEFRLMMQQLTNRKQKLQQLETNMIIEKKEFKQKIEEFITWREKLEILEKEIEKRRQFLSEQEKFLNEQYDKVLSHELTSPASYTKEIEAEKEIEEEQTEDPGLIEKEDLFNSLNVEAAILQRGRIKKINKLFEKMLGHAEHDLIGRHLVDFITPLGLEGVEHHYMNRLKGIDNTSYRTVFLSKNKDEISVKVHIKNTDFHGEKVEIATFKEL